MLIVFWVGGYVSVSWLISYKTIQCGYQKMSVHLGKKYKLLANLTGHEEL